MAINFESLLDTNMDDVERPIPVPQGSYLASVKGYEATTSKDGNTGGFIFTLTLISPFEDTVDQDELDDYGDISEREPTMRWYVWQGKDEKSVAYPFKRFLDSVLNVPVDGRTLSESMADSVGQQCLITVIHKMNQENEPFAVIDAVATVED